MALQDTLKSQDTEEWLDLVFYRPAGYCWALFFRKTGATPNFVTLLSILLGVASGVMFYYTDVWINAAGVLLLVWANIYDSADGQLARMTGNYSRVGRILDGLAGDFWFISIYVALACRLTPTFGFSIWILAVAAGFCHSMQAAVADYIRNFHLLFVKGRNNSEFDDSSQLKARDKSLAWKNDRIEKLFMYIYIPYTKGQERQTPQLQAFKRALATQFGDGDPPAGFRNTFRMASRPMMPYTNILSFNTRAIALFASVLCDVPWAYFLFDLTLMNALLFYLIYQYERICKRFNLRLRGDDRY